MPLRRSTRFTAIALTVAAATTAVIIAGVVYNSSSATAAENTRICQQRVALERSAAKGLHEGKAQGDVIAATIANAVAGGQTAVNSVGDAEDESQRLLLRNTIKSVDESVTSAVKSLSRVTTTSELQDGLKTLNDLADGGTQKIAGAVAGLNASAADHQAKREQKAEADAQQARADKEAQAQAQAQSTTTPCPCAQNPCPKCPKRPCPCPYANSNTQSQNSSSGQTESTSSSTAAADSSPSAQSSPCPHATSPCPYANR